MLLNHFFDIHYLSYNPSTSARTIQLYRSTFRMFGQWLGHQPTLDDLQNEIVGKYISDLFRSHRRPATVNKERSQLLAVWNHAHKLGMISLGPLVKPVKAPDIVPTALSVNQLQQLCLSFHRLAGETQGVPNCLLIQACFHVQYTTAERVGAVIRLEWSDIRENKITFRAENRKCGRKSITRTVPDYVIESLESIRTNSAKVFPVMKGIGKMALLYKRLFERAGVPRPRYKSSHLLRSTHATFLHLVGGDASESLGHSNPATTKKSYLDPRMANLEFWKMLPKLDVS